MKTKSIPAIIMLTAGLVTCIVGILTHIETIRLVKVLLIVLLIFYVLGCIVKMIIDSNFKEMEEDTTDGEDVSENDEADGEQEQKPEQPEEEQEEK